MGMIAESGARAFPVLRPMRPGSVPEIGPRYWMLICLASVAGCNLGDFVSHILGLGHRAGLVPLAVVFAVLVTGERRARHPGETWYWATLLILRTAATNISDLLTHKPVSLPFPWVIAALELALVLVILPVPARLAPSRATPGVRPVTTGWYWLAMLTAGTLGTAIGDCTTEQFGVGLGVGTVALGAILAVVLALGARWRWSTKAAYWFGVVAVRAAGTTAGDWFAFGQPKLGLLAATGLTCAVFAAAVLAWRSPTIAAQQPA